MSKQVLVMRHAKSSWDQVGLSDYQRPLNERGLRDTPNMAQHVIDERCVPNLIASSSAVRARQTAELFVQHCVPQYSPRLILVDDFYHAPPKTYLQYLSDLKEDAGDIVMVVGHNPGLEELVSDLAGRSEHFPTAAIARFKIRVERWSEISDAAFELKSLWRPKEL